jgi:hypothetical protein
MKLVMAVHAEQDALIELSPQILAAAVVASAEDEPLPRAIEMMEAERAETPVVSADLTPAAFVGDHFALQRQPVHPLVRSA